LFEVFDALGRKAEDKDADVHPFPYWVPGEVATAHTTLGVILVFGQSPDVAFGGEVVGFVLNKETGGGKFTG